MAPSPKRRSLPLIKGAEVRGSRRAGQVLSTGRGGTRTKLRGTELGRRKSSTPCRKDWLWLAKRALLSWPGGLSRGERLKGKEASPTPLPRGEGRGRDRGGGLPP